MSMSHVMHEQGAGHTNLWQTSPDVAGSTSMTLRVCRCPLGSALCR